MFTLKSETPDSKVYLATARTLSRIGANSLITTQAKPTHFAKLFYYVGEQGSGKSCLLTKHLLESCLDSTLTNLPLITLIHRGDENTRLVKTLKAALPAYKSFLATDKMINNTTDSAINPFDTLLGATTAPPITRHNAERFLTTLLTPSERAEPYSHTASMVDYLVQHVFEATHGKKPTIHKMYSLGDNLDLDRAVISHRIVDMYEYMKKDADGGVTMKVRLPNSEAIGYAQLARRLHIAGLKQKTGCSTQKELFYARDIAHSLSVPVLGDLLTVLNNMPPLLHSEVNPDTGERSRDYAYRIIEQSIEDYPCFANPTRIHLNDARVVAINLKQVITGNHRNDMLFIQAARMAAMKKVGYRNSDIHSEIIDDIYLSHHTDHLKAIFSDYKVVAYEGMEIINGDNTLRALFESDARERRPLGVDMVLTSTTINDFNFSLDSEKPYLALYATDFFFTSKPSSTEIDVFKSVLTDNEEVVSDLDFIDANTFFAYSRPQTERLSDNLVITKLQPRRPNR